MSDTTSILDPKTLRIAALVVAVTGLPFVYFRDTWMIAAAVTLSGGLILLAGAEAEDDPRQRRFAYVCFALAVAFMLIDAIGTLVAPA
ncbi:hypothetical protein CRI94_14915 [Longibacter salinarum]|uniref:Phosphatidate cytidylyltransferase n=1 Tax=Longibacter salinarum TaxID=1850348 RepID=A0A2A8CUR7_9BACT|nr:hypothetical protein [Longibacter salinarum]PEN12312.1 hypothetical protein CRI94_14915 [Longibacter salinarum]